MTRDLNKNAQLEIYGRKAIKKEQMARHLTKIEKQKTDSRAQQHKKQCCFDSRKLAFSWRIINQIATNNMTFTQTYRTLEEEAAREVY